MKNIPFLIDEHKKALLDFAKMHVDKLTFCEKQNYITYVGFLGGCFAAYGTGSLAGHKSED